MTNFYYAALFINSFLAVEYFYYTLSHLVECLRDKELHHHIPYIVLPYLLLTIIFGSIVAGAFYAKQYGNNTKTAISILLLPFAIVTIAGILATMFSVLLKQNQ